MSHPSPAAGALDGLLRGLGGLLALVAGSLTGLLAVVLVPLRVADAGELAGGGVGRLVDGLAGTELLAGLAGTGLGATRVPVAIVVAAGGNLLLLRFAEWATGQRWGVLLPGLGWLLVIWAALRITTEGDRLLPLADWVGTLTLFTGTMVLVVGTVLALTSPRGPARSGAPRVR